MTEKFRYCTAIAILPICLNAYILLLFSGRLEDAILRIGTFAGKPMRKMKKRKNGN